MDSGLSGSLQSRKRDVREGQMPRWDVGRATAFSVAEAASNGLRYARKAELLKEQLSAFIVQVYERDGAGNFVNIDPVDFRVMLRVPWRKEWRDPNLPALRATERAALRAILKAQQQNDNLAHVFHYDRPYWYVQVHDYRSSGQALAWVERVKIDGATYNIVDTRRRTARRVTDSGT